MTLHLTRDEWERIAAEGGGVLFRPGIEIGGDECGADEDEPDTFPPAEFVETAKPCEYPSISGFTDYHICGSENCLDGKRRIAVTVPCKGCRAGYWEEHGCDGAGGMVLTIGHVVVRWGPCEVVPMDQEWRNHTHVTVIPDAENPLILWEHTGNPHMPYRTSRLPLPPDVDPQSLVGQYAIGIEVVDP